MTKERKALTAWMDVENRWREGGKEGRGMEGEKEEGREGTREGYGGLRAKRGLRRAVVNVFQRGEDHEAIVVRLRLNDLCKVRNSAPEVSNQHGRVENSFRPP